MKRCIVLLTKASKTTFTQRSSEKVVNPDLKLLGDYNNLTCKQQQDGKVLLIHVPSGKTFTTTPVSEEEIAENIKALEDFAKNGGW